MAQRKGFSAVLYDLFGFPHRSKHIPTRWSHKALDVTQYKTKRHEHACAPRKPRETENPSPVNFARNALECDASLHRVDNTRSSKSYAARDGLPRPTLTCHSGCSTGWAGVTSDWL